MSQGKASASIRSAVSKAQELGFSGLLAYAAKRAFRAVIFRKDVLLVFALSRGLGDARNGSLGSQHDLRWLDARLLRSCQEQRPEYFSRRTDADQRLAQGERCYALFVEGRLVTVGWVGLRSAIEAAPEVGSRFSVTLGERVPVIYDCWTVPESRGRGYYSRVLESVAVGLLDQYEQVWIYCLEANSASARGIQNAGFRPRLTHIRRRFFGIERHLTAPVAS